MKVVKTSENTEWEAKKLVVNEAKILQKLDHPNIVKLINFWEDAEYTPSSSCKRNVSYLALELAERGDLITFISKNGALSENIGRFYFSQLINSLDYVHSNGFWHLDIKPDNILFDKEFNLKLWDFGFSSEIKMQTTK